MSDTRPPARSAIQRAVRFSGRTLRPDEFQAYVDAPVSEAERQEALRLIRWFTRRYPTPAERLAYVRRAHSRWKGRE